MSYYNIEYLKIKKLAEEILEYRHQLEEYILNITSIKNTLLVSKAGFALEIENLNNVLQEIEDEKGNLEYIGKALNQIVKLYIETEKKLLGEEKEEDDKTVLESVNDLWVGITYRAMALGEGVIDTAVDGIIGAYKLLVEPVGRLGLLFKDWNLRGFGFISEEEWQKRESQYCEYANGLTSGISDTLLNVFNFKNLEENTILSPFAYCYNHFGEYISSDASYEDMVDYSKNAVNAFATVAPLAGKAATSLKPKMKNLKSSRTLANAAVSKGAGNGKVQRKLVIKEGVLANIAESKAAREASNFSEHVKLEKAIPQGGTKTKLDYVTSNGLVLESTPSKTTTVLGTYRSDTGAILDELGNVKSLDFGPRDGSFNLLNTPDELYVSPNQFWDEYNKLWLDNAIERNDIFKIVTEPTWDNLTRINMYTGKIELTGFGREYTYLRKHGYVFDSVTKTMSK